MMNMQEAVKSFGRVISYLMLRGSISPDDEEYWNISVDFINADNEPDETQLDIRPESYDYKNGRCAELEEIWKEFCKENRIQQNSIMMLHFGEAA